MIVAHLQQAGKVYDGGVRTRALAPTTLDLEGGELTLLLGPSGSGKTTLLNLLGGLDRPTEGEVWVEGREVSALSLSGLTRYRRELVGMVFQFFNLVSSLTAQENVLLAAELRGGSPADARRWLGSVGLTGKEDRFPSELSGGEQQRVAIARALSKRPHLLLADEPTGALDHDTGQQVVKLLDAAARDQACAVVVVTHDEGLLPWASRVVRLRDGVVVSDQRRPGRGAA